MKADILNTEGKKVKSIELPIQFNEEYRPDLIRRAVLAMQSHGRQPYGASPEAGKRHSVTVRKRRRTYRTSYGQGISRSPRKIHSKSGRHISWTGAFAPFTVGGRRAHPPKVEKELKIKINVKERRKAIRSAIAATTNITLVQERGHVAVTAPLVVDHSFESLSKAKDVVVALKKL